MLFTLKAQFQVKLLSFAFHFLFHLAQDELAYYTKPVCANSWTYVKGRLGTKGNLGIRV